jgi:hypothetical protein
MIVTGRNLWRAGLAMAGLVLLAGCDDMRNALGMERHVPDETKVVSRPPLTLPPDFNLRPPGSATPVSGEHETGLSLSQVGTPEKPKEEKGFFGRLFGGDDDDNKEAAPDSGKAETPSPDVNGTPVPDKSSSQSGAQSTGNSAPAGTKSP